MRCVMRCILASFVAAIFLCGTISAGMAAEMVPLPLPDANAAVVAEQENPAISFPAEGSYSFGYRWFSGDDSLEAARYAYPHSSVTFALDVLFCPLPYRYHAHAEFLSDYDFYADAGFAYQDLVLFRDILVGVHHNLPHLGYPADPVHIERNPGENYYLDFASNLLSLRLKAPDFPLHAFVTHRHIQRSGKIQQRFLLGDFAEINKVSQSREIDWKSNALKLGTNSHVGPVEIEYSYDHSRFDPGRNNILYDSYPESPIFARPADIYPHDVVPETEASGHTIKLHSSYTGGIVAAATLGTLSEKNNYSLSKATTRKGAFDLSWIPDPMVGLFFKYRHRSVDMENPGVVALAGQGNTLYYPVRKAVSYERDVFSLATRYRPARNLSLFATYEFSHLSRKDVDEWVVLPGHTNVHRLNLTAQASPLANLKVKAIYEYKNYSQPAYNNTPDYSNTMRLTTNYTPAPWLNLYLEYLLAVTERNGLRYLNSDPYLLLEVGERSGRRDQFLVSLSSELSPRVTATASWFYQRREAKQDLAYGKWLMAGVGDLPYIDFGVPYTDEANSFSLALHCLPREDITLSADVTYTISEGTTGYNDVVGGATFSLASYSALQAAETVFSLGLAKKLSKEWELGLRSYMAIHNDRVHDSLDGNVFTTTFRIKRYF